VADGKNPLIGYNVVELGGTVISNVFLIARCPQEELFERVVENKNTA